MQMSDHLNLNKKQESPTRLSSAARVKRVRTSALGSDCASDSFGIMGCDDVSVLSAGGMSGTMGRELVSDFLPELCWAAMHRSERRRCSFGG